MGNKFSSEYRKLNSVDIDTVPKLPNQNKKTLAKIVKVYDGDTCTCLFMHDKKVPTILNIRIKGIDAPELKSKNINEKEAATLVRDFVANKIKDKIVNIKLESWDKYGGRALGEVYIKKKGREVPLSNYLVEEHLAKPYDGSKKEVWKRNELSFIIDKLK